jgi:hypothetical protein
MRYLSNVHAFWHMRYLSNVHAFWHMRYLSNVRVFHMHLSSKAQAQE